jgi:hypothetical protein
MGHIRMTYVRPLLELRMMDAEGHQSDVKRKRVIKTGEVLLGIEIRQVGDHPPTALALRRSWRYRARNAAHDQHFIA